MKTGNIRLFLDRRVIKETQGSQKNSASLPVVQERRQGTRATTLKLLTKSDQ
jgi:hypothetical protein